MDTRQDTIDTFGEHIQKDIEYTKTFKPKQPHQNLNKGEKRQLRNYQKRKISSLLMLIKEERLSL